MGSLLHLEVVSPEQVVISEDVNYVSLPGMNGELGILPEHLPLLAALKIGEMHYTQGTSTHYVFISGGFVELSDNTLTILTDAAERASNINTERALQAKRRAEARLMKTTEDIDIARAQAAMQRAMIRLTISRLQ